MCGWARWMGLDPGYTWKFVDFYCPPFAGRNTFAEKFVLLGRLVCACVHSKILSNKMCLCVCMPRKAFWPRKEKKTRHNHSKTTTQTCYELGIQTRRNWIEFIPHKIFFVVVVALLFSVLLTLYSAKHLCRHGQEYELRCIWTAAAAAGTRNTTFVFWIESDRIESNPPKYSGIWPKIIAFRRLTNTDYESQRKTNITSIENIEWRRQKKNTQRKRWKGRAPNLYEECVECDYCGCIIHKLLSEHLCSYIDQDQFHLFSLFKAEMERASDREREKRRREVNIIEIWRVERIFFVRRWTKERKKSVMCIESWITSNSIFKPKTFNTITSFCRPTHPIIWIFQSPSFSRFYFSSNDLLSLVGFLLAFLSRCLLFETLGLRVPAKWKWCIYDWIINQLLFSPLFLISLSLSLSPLICFLYNMIDDFQLIRFNIPYMKRVANNLTSQ